jgi:hypothetical protein
MTPAREPPRRRHYACDSWHPSVTLNATGLEFERDSHGFHFY